MCGGLETEWGKKRARGQKEPARPFHVQSVRRVIRRRQTDWPSLCWQVAYFVTIYGLQWYLGPKPEGEAAKKEVGTESEKNSTEKQYSSHMSPICMEPSRSMPLHARRSDLPFGPLVHSAVFDGRASREKTPISIHLASSMTTERTFPIATSPIMCASLSLHSTLLPLLLSPSPLLSL